MTLLKSLRSLFSPASSNTNKINESIATQSVSNASQSKNTFAVMSGEEYKRSVGCYG
ncbi:hypothetical protein DDB_G0281169 [Dictyostelium discoideum AX4]|uniref:Uncharacterized protein n=1 Tax=Dictyostelium discoideum TaxID=44689 RepID=Q54UB9_DICDI|nr:hypothetical protein DDB_G0281169 [Dictyostelium discoideum AX4]EAL66881.1 hypothetical protein DDB_G0281169 [Dictyostelium discoideum AX4]|eukprot:XP_640857.1 hypothetical protein DDB_G0281169 [Dictyostelium discoideum AX4]